MELKLKRKGADAVIIKSTIQKLLEYGFLDEKRYGQRVFEAWLYLRKGNTEPTF